MKPLVSVWIVTYCHEDFIAKAIESVLMQKTNFDFDIVIGEDCSPDGTRKIIEQFVEKHPDKIKPIYHTQNVGASRNAYEFTMPACTGKYVAFLEGDDYWTDKNKLQKQVDFMEQNDDFSACAHQATVVYEDSSVASIQLGGKEDDVYLLNDMLQHRKFHTSTLVIKNELIKKYGHPPLSLLSADRALIAMLSIFGKIKYFAKPMGVYRRNNTSISNGLTIKKLASDLIMVPWLKSLDEKFPAKRLKSFVHFTSYTYAAKIQFIPLVKHYTLFVIYSFSYFPKNLRDIKHGTELLFSSILTFCGLKK